MKSSPEVSPAGTRRYAVTCANPAAALAEATRLTGVRDATLYGDRLHVLADEELEPERLLILIAPGDSSATFQEVGPSLEDVFVLLSRGQTRH